MNAASSPARNACTSAISSADVTTSPASSAATPTGCPSSVACSDDAIEALEGILLSMAYSSSTTKLHSDEMIRKRRATSATYHDISIRLLIRMHPTVYYPHA